MLKTCLSYFLCLYALFYSLETEHIWTTNYLLLVSPVVVTYMDYERLTFGFPCCCYIYGLRTTYFWFPLLLLHIWTTNYLLLVSPVVVTYMDYELLTFGFSCCCYIYGLRTTYFWLLLLLLHIWTTNDLLLVSPVVVTAKYRAPNSIRFHFYFLTFLVFHIRFCSLIQWLLYFIMFQVSH